MSQFLLPQFAAIVIYLNDGPEYSTKNNQIINQPKGLTSSWRLKTDFTNFKSGN